MSALLHAAFEAGMNMMRIWGGGLYESEHFYNLCDELGLLVWQDFPYACAYYPDTGEYAEASRIEAIAAVRRLRSHASLALWCGNNENHQLFHDNWTGTRPPRFLGEKLYHEVLPAVVEAEDPNRPYWPSSPYGGENPNAQNTGDCHDWNVWHGVGDWIHYPQNNARFLSEFGFASSCGLGMWDSCLSEEDKSPRSPAVRWHDKTRKGYETYLGYIALHYPEPQTLEDLVYYSQINQAEAVKCGIEHWRRQKGRCWGTLFWQWNDCWPVQSWAVIDAEGEPKAAYFVTVKFYAPVLFSLVRKGNEVEAHLTSDYLRPVSGTYTLTLESFDGTRLAEQTGSATVEANGSTQVGSLSLDKALGHEESVYLYVRFTPDEESDVEDSENFLLLAEPKDLRLPDPRITLAVEQLDPESFLVTVSSERFAPSVWLRLKDVPERVGKVEWSDNFFHLRPNQPREILLYVTGDQLTKEEVRARLTFRSL